MGEIIGYFGVPGSNTHEAKLAIFGEGQNERYSETFEGIFKLLMEGSIKYGVLPVENSSTGGISEVVDLLNKYDAYIVGEKCMKITNNLLGIEGTTLQDIEEVYSHPQVLLQCKDFLRSQNGWKLFDYFNTAKSAQYVKESNSKSKVAIGNSSAAKLFGLSVVKENISTNEHNYTRFIIISKTKEISAEADKISVVLNLPHEPGSLYNVIKIIYENKLNMMKIESRPITNKPWQYSFYIDFEGNLNNAKVKEALRIIQETSTDFKLLGNYKKDN